MKGKRQPRKIIGWRELVSLPDLGIPVIKAKIDTGARTSSIHASDIRLYEKDGIEFVEFHVSPLNNNGERIKCRAMISDRRRVRDSGGHSEKRYFIKTNLSMGDEIWEIELALANRLKMRFKMLLGREALSGHAVVDPGRSYMLGKDLLGGIVKRKGKK